MKKIHGMDGFKIKDWPILTRNCGAMEQPVLGFRTLSLLL